jgi:MFS superfamily sulfate permease-like transporter
MMVVVTVIVSMIVMRIQGILAGAVRVVVMFDRIAARAASMRTHDGDDAGENGAQQRQENDCLDHSRVSPSSD